MRYLWLSLLGLVALAALFGVQSLGVIPSSATSPQGIVGTDVDPATGTNNHNNCSLQETADLGAISSPTVTVDFCVTDNSIPSPGMGAFQFRFLFNPAVLSLVSVATGDPAGTSYFLEKCSIGGEPVALFDVQAPGDAVIGGSTLGGATTACTTSLLAPGGRLATVTFDCLSSGSSVIDLRSGFQSFYVDTSQVRHEFAALNDGTITSVTCGGPGPTPTATPTPGGPTPTSTPTPTVTSTPTPTPVPRTIRVPADALTIQAGIDAAVDRDTVLVAPGTYYENIDFRGKAITVTGEQGPAVTTIDGNRSGSVVTFDSGEGPESVLRGFTLQNGLARFESGYMGGGIVIRFSSPTVAGNVVTNNAACAGGGGIGIYLGSPMIQYNTIKHNTQSSCSGGTGGGGIDVVGGRAAQILDNIIANNSWGTSNGGGITIFDAGTPKIRGNIIRGNTARNDGGGIWMVNQSDALIVQNFITGNTALRGGGIHWLVPFGARGPLLVNNTIADNDSPQGSGIFADGFDRQTEVVNNIVIGKEGQTAILCGDFNDMNPPILEFNDVFSPLGTAYGGICSDQTGINGNISADPLFVDPSSGDYHLQPGSPAIDAGDNNAPGLPGTDLDGGPRLIDGDGDGEAVIDMGAYEFDPSRPAPTLHDADLRRISAAFAVLGGVELDLRELFVQVRNESDQAETVGVYLDVIPPGGPSDPYGCLPNGRVLETTVSLDTGDNKQANVFADTGTSGDGLVEFSCADHAGAVGKSYTSIAVVDVHADDLAACGQGSLQSLACFDALADDDTDPADNRALHSTRVQKP